MLDLDLTKVEGIDLTKGDLLDLSKGGLETHKLRVGAGWNCVEREMGSFMGFLFGKTQMLDVDLDLIAVLEDKNGRELERVYFNHKTDRHNAIRLDKDDRQGEAVRINIDYRCTNTCKDTENMTVILSNLPDNVQHVRFAVAIYDENTFRDVPQAYCKLVDETEGRVLCSFKMSEDGGRNKSIRMLTLHRAGTSWTLEAIGEYTPNRWNNV
jgi:tellurium resistance protein TerZ